MKLILTITIVIGLYYLVKYLCSQGVQPPRIKFKSQKQPRKQHKSRRRGRSSRYCNPRRRKRYQKKGLM